jgi:hypothetical protein
MASFTARQRLPCVLYAQDPWQNPKETKNPKLWDVQVLDGLWFLYRYSEGAREYRGDASDRSFPICHR